MSEENNVQPQAVKECSDKLALIKFTVYNIRQMRKSGMSDEKIRQILSQQFEFSDGLLDQLM